MKHGTTKTLKVSCIFLVFFLFSAIAFLPQPVRAAGPTLINTGGDARGCAASPDGKYVYVANNGGSFSSFNYLGWVSVIDTSSNTVIANIVDPNEPAQVVVSPNNQSVYAMNGDPSGVSVIDTDPNSPTFDQVTTTIPITNSPSDIAISPDGEYVYVSDGSEVTEINASSNTIVNTISVVLPTENGNVVGLAVTPNGEYIYAACGITGGCYVRAINIADWSVTTNITDSDSPEGVTITPSGIAYVDNYYGSVLVIDTATNAVTTLSAAATGMPDPTGMAVSPDGAYVYFANAAGDQLTQMSTGTNTVTATYAFAHSGFSIGIVALANGYAYVTDPDNTGVWVINAPEDWVMFRSNPIHTGIGIGNPVLNATVLWKTQTGSIVRSSPAVVGGVVYIGSEDGKVYALNASTGLILWSYLTNAVPDSDVYSSPAVAGGVVYVGSGDGAFYALNATNGLQLWNYTTDNGFLSSPAVVDSVVYTGGGLDVYAFDATNGTMLWNYPTGGSVYSSPAVVGGVVYVGSENDRVYALNATNGAVLWSYLTGGWVDSSPAVVGGAVYVGSDDNNVYALNATNGFQLWNYTSYKVESSPAVVDGVVYIGSDGLYGGAANVTALNATDGTVLWNFPTGASVESSPAVVGGVVYVGSADDNVYALNATNGAELWNYPTGDNVLSSPAVVNGTVYVGSWDWYVYALAPSAPTPTVSISPTSATLDVGQSQLFTANPSGGSGTYSSYQWYVNGSAQSDQNASTFSFAPALADSYSITATVNDSSGATSAQSNAASVTVSASPTVSVAPAGPFTLDIGQSQLFTATASGGSGSISYQWYLDGATVGSNSASYSYTAASGSHSVTCNVTDSATTPVTSPTSNAVSITVNSALVAPTVSPSLSAVNQSQTSILTPSTVTSGTSPYTYRWYEKAPGASSFSLINGADLGNYSFAPSSSTATGNWSFIVQVTDNAGSAVNSTATTVAVNTSTSTTPASGLSSWVIGLIIAIVVIVVVLLILFMWFRRGKKKIIASADDKGTISPKGTVTVKRGADQTFTIKANPHYQISDVQVDGKSVGAKTEYTFNKVKEDHTITAVFKPE